MVVTPSRVLREVAAQLARIKLREDAVLLSCTKGVERGSGARMSQILAEFFPEHTVAVLSGPSHAEEVARRMPTAVVLGCADSAIVQRLQQAFTTKFFRAYTSDDVAGIELGGALKNIFAIAAGVSDGLGLGDNSKAALVTRALAELIRLGTALGGRRETFHGLSGIGDLIVTCFSRHSRNRAVGERLGKGEPLDGNYRLDADGRGGCADHLQRCRMRARARHRDADHRANARVARRRHLAAGSARQSAQSRSAPGAMILRARRPGK